MFECAKCFWDLNGKMMVYLAHVHFQTYWINCVLFVDFTTTKNQEKHKDKIHPTNTKCNKKDHSHLDGRMLNAFVKANR